MIIFCKKCGNKVEIEAKFCTNCGCTVKSKCTYEGSVDKYFENKRTDLIVEVKKKANNEMLQGVVWFALALLITLGSYVFASDGESYQVLIGAIIYGVYRLVRGFWYKLNPESLIENVESKLGNN